MKKIILLLSFLISTPNIILAQFTNKFVTYSTANTPVFSGNNFKAIWVGKGNQIWAGTQYQGLYRFDTARKAWTKSSALTNVFINQIQSDQKRGIWIAQSGTSGTSGGGSNTAGGVNYFPDTTDAGMQFFTTSNFLSSRNVRSVYLDTFNAPPGGKRRTWVAQATYITSGNTSAGGIVKWQDTATGNFQKVYTGLQVFPNTNVVSSGTPSCYTVSGNSNEVYVGVETNYTAASGSTTQILKYDARTGSPLGGYDQNGQFDNTRLYYNNQPRNYIDTSSKGVLQAGFRTTAMYTDKENRLWIGLRTGGVAVKIGAQWKSVNMPQMFPAGTTVNFNAITSDEYGYVYIGTSNGIVVFNDGGDVTDTSSYTLITTANGLPSNNITGLAYDKAGGRMLVASDAGVTFWQLSYKINVQMLWDYSYPNRDGQPIGVAADGVSRIYLKIKKASDTLPNIKSVTVSLKGFDATQANIRGKLKPAIVINKYSEEASTGTTPQVTLSNADLFPDVPYTYYFWYVAPDDFCSDTTSIYANLRKRFDTLTVIATYLNGKKDTIDYKIGIVRPPTLFVHGLASSPEAWDSLKHNYFGSYIPLVTSPVFTYKRAPSMDPIAVFQKNAAQLLGGDISVYNNNGDRENTLQGCIDALRGMRYAANQVDYICHSMGGIMIRSAIGLYPKKFYAGDGDPYLYKTYKKGFTHKIITINTPHNNAPIADVVDQFAPLAPIPIKLVLNNAYNLAPVFIGGFFKPVGSGNALGIFKATDAVNNLQVTDARGGVNLLKTTAKFHMLISNLNWTQYTEKLGTVDDYLVPVYKSLLQVMYLSTYDPSIFDPTTAEQTRNFLAGLLTQQSPVMLANFLNWMAAKRDYPNYLANSDGIVPLPSERARIDEPQTYITKFFNTDTANRSAGFNSFHTAVMFRNDIGQRVFQLLNTRLGSPVFGDEIPANTDRETPFLLRTANSSRLAARTTAAPVVQTFFDTVKIKIDAPSAGSTVYADSILNIKFRIKDTSRMVYLSLHFQATDSFRVMKTFAQQTISFKVDPALLSNSNIYAMAMYTNATNNGLDYYVDTFSLNGVNLAPLQGFRIKQDLVEIKGGQPYYPEYEAEYNNAWIRLPNNDPNIVATIDSVNTVSYDTAARSFNGLQNGNAIANFTYKTFTDSLLFKVVMPYNSNCINTSIASGSFKNPAIWSKGMVPDICDSVIISSGNSVTVDASATIRALRISSGGTLTFNNNYTLQLGQGDDGLGIADNYGTLNISSGSLYVNGRVRMNTSAAFNMSGGNVTIDANKGIRETSIANGDAPFEADAGMATFNFSGGTLQINNPPYGAASQAINCPYDFGSNSTLILGINNSVVSSNNPDGFGGVLFPNKIGKLIIDAGTQTGNRQLIIKKALGVKGSVVVKPGSGIILQAPLNVSP